MDKQIQNPERKESRLEKIVRTVKNEAKEYMVDTSASLLYANTIFGAGEYFIAGMEPDKLLKTRIGMSLIGCVIYRPFSKFREYWAKLWKTDAESSKTKKFLTDVSGNITFFAPIYTGIMYLSGASWEEMGAALPAGMLTAIITARPYGWFLDKWRKMFGTKPTLDSYVEKNQSFLDSE